MYTALILSFLFIEHLLVNNSYAILLSALFVPSLSVTSGKCLRCALCLCSSFSLSFVTYTNGPLDSFGLPLPRCLASTTTGRIGRCADNPLGINIFIFRQNNKRRQWRARTLPLSLPLSPSLFLTPSLSRSLSLWLSCKICLCL